MNRSMVIEEGVEVIVIQCEQFIVFQCSSLQLVYRLNDTFLSKIDHRNRFINATVESKEKLWKSLSRFSETLLHFLNHQCSKGNGCCLKKSHG